MKTNIYIYFFIGLLAIISSCFEKPHIDFQKDHSYNFQKWIQVHRKKYSSIQDSITRFQIWAKNFQMIKDHNKRFQQGLQTYQLELNQFADLTLQEYASAYLMNNFPSDSSGCETGSFKNSFMLKQIDWVKQGAVTKIKHQRKCSSGWAFASVGALQGAYKISNKNKLLQFSQQQLIDCSNDYQNEGCKGGTIQNALKYVVNKGIIQEKYYPYQEKHDLCFYQANDGYFNRWNISNCRNIFPWTTQNLKQAVSRQPVAIGISANNFGFQFYKSGIFNLQNCQKKLNHAMLIVGFSEQKGHKYWKLKNSFGQLWGQQGFIRISMKEESGVCGMNQKASYPQI